MWLPNGSMVWPHGHIGVSDGLNSGRRSLHLRLHVKIQRTSLFDGMLRQRETRGYNVWGEREVLGIIGVDFMVKLCPKVFIAV
jgi:hypothetical protein